MRPVPRGTSAGFFRGRYKESPQDFEVEEVPAYEPSGRGDHVWMWVEKRALSTLDLLHEMARHLERDEREFGIAGLKDAQAVSRQWVSLEHGDLERCGALRGERFAVQRATRHGNKLRMGHLHGNRFAIVLRGTAAGDLDRAQQALAELARLGVPNYFGEQRFGKRGANLQKGLDVLRGNARAFAARMPRRVFGLVISAVQSEVFNRVVAARRDEVHLLRPGDLAFLHRNGAVFAVEDAAREQARAETFELSPSGPMPGPEMPWPTGRPLEIERQALADVGVSAESFEGLPFRLARGERRPLRVPVTDAAASAVDGGLRLSFALPRGAYATAVLRELLEETIWFAG
jgi:tRNA pseudouridine13 synthase